MKAILAYDADLLFVSANAPVMAVIRAKISHMRPILQSSSGRRPGLAGRKAKVKEHAKLDI
jgi:hypothetical protein